MLVSLRIALLAAVLAACACAVQAATIDGKLDAEYGAALSIQTTATSLGDMAGEFTPLDSLNISIGSELDGAYGFVADGTLHLCLAGNIRSYFGEPLMFPDQLQLYIDCLAGGQNTLSGDNSDVGSYVRLRDMAGLAFDSGFAPDYWLAAQVELSGSMPFFAYYAELPTTGVGVGYGLGRTGGGGPGTLAGGTNPFGVLCSIDQTNRAGVTAGCDAASGAGVMTGVEWAIPLAALGNPSGSIRICALIARAPGQVSNQVLGPVPPGTCSLGAASGVDFSSVPGAQYFTLDTVAPVTRASWGRLKRRYRGR